MVCVCVKTHPYLQEGGERVRKKKRTNKIINNLFINFIIYQTHRGL